MNKKQIFGIIKYVLGLLGFLGVILAILTVTNLLDVYLVKINYPYTFDVNTKLTVSLTSSIIGIFFLFIAFSNQLDKFFNFLESHTVTKPEDKNGITIESIFFFLIGVVLVTLTVMLAIGFLTLKTEIIGKYTREILLGALILLSIVSFITAFNNIIAQSIKEMRKVHWPTGNEMLKLSAQVFSFIIFFSLLFLALDLVLSHAPNLVERIFNIEL